MGFVILFHNFANWTNTILVGVPISFTNKKIWKAFWLLVLLVTTICCALQIYILIHAYLKFEKSSVIRPNYAQSLPFPAVTICNLNPFKNSKVNNSQSLQNLITAYNYVIGKKLQQSQEDTLSITTSTKPSTDVVQIRNKRAPCPAGTYNSSVIPPGYSVPQVYSVVCITGSTLLLQFTTCNGTGASLTSNTIKKQSFNSTMQTQMEQAFYLCLMPAYCNGGCGSWPDALSILTSMTKCIQNNNISSPYPAPGPSNPQGPTFATLVAEGVAQNCSYLNSSCNLYIYPKPNNPMYPGNWWSEECSNTYIFGADSCSGGTYSYNGTLNSCTNYTAVLAARVVQAENDGKCRTSSTNCTTNTTNPCPYSYNSGCDGQEYQNFVCSVLDCNLTTTTLMPTTTFLTTHFDLTTIESTTMKTSTTVMTSTIMSSTTTLTPTTTVAPTTTAASSITTGSTTITSTLAPTTTVIPTTTISSTMTPTTISTTTSSTTTTAPTTTITTTVTMAPTTTSTSSASSSTSTAPSSSTNTTSRTITPTTKSTTATTTLAGSTSTSAASTNSITTVAKSTIATTPMTTSKTTLSTSISTSATSTKSTSNMASSTTMTTSQTLSAAITNASSTRSTKTITTKSSVSSTFQSATTTGPLTSTTPQTIMTSLKTLATTMTPLATTITQMTTTTSTSTTIGSVVSSSLQTSTQSVRYQTQKSIATTVPQSTATSVSTSTIIATKPLTATVTPLQTTTRPISASASTITASAPISALSLSSTKTKPQSIATLTSLGVITASSTSPALQSTATAAAQSTETSKILDSTLSASNITRQPSSVSSLIGSTTSNLNQVSNIISTASLGTTIINNPGLTNFMESSGINAQNSLPSTKGITASYNNDAPSSILPQGSDSKSSMSTSNLNYLMTLQDDTTQITGSMLISSLTDSQDSTLTDNKSDLLTTIASKNDNGADSLIETTTKFDQTQEYGNGETTKNPNHNTYSVSSEQPVASSDLYKKPDKFGESTTQYPYPTTIANSYLNLQKLTTTANLHDTDLFEDFTTTLADNTNTDSALNGKTRNFRTSENPAISFSTDSNLEDVFRSYTGSQEISNNGNIHTTKNAFKSSGIPNNNEKAGFGILTTSYDNFDYQELNHTKIFTEFMGNTKSAQKLITTEEVLGNSNNFLGNMNSSFTSSSPKLFGWSMSSSPFGWRTSLLNNNGNDINTSNTNPTYTTGITNSSNYVETNNGPTSFPITMTTSAANYNLTNLDIVISCPTCFNLSNLTASQISILDQISVLYGLNPNDSIVTIDANFQAALNYVAAIMNELERQECGYMLTDLVQSCVIAGNPCNLTDDFTLTFDVDYGNCYTFNYQYPDIKYNTTRSGAPNGLRMLVMSEVSEYLPSTSEAGIKITLQTQDYSPFPNVEGYKFGVGVMGGIYVTYNKYTRLDAPYGSCSSLDKIKELNQPFYYNGTYSTEGCLRSCWQDKLVANCSCADARISYPSDKNVPFCSYLNETQELCKTTYINENGDYYAVQGCQCDLPCEEQTYDSQLFEATWPEGGFLYEYYCTQYNITEECQNFYSKNAVKIEVSYSQMGYLNIDETPVFDLFKLLNSMAGALILWIGFSSLILAEFMLVFIQICIWCCTKTKELPDVPSLRSRNIEERKEREERFRRRDFREHVGNDDKFDSITNLKQAPINPENMFICSGNNMAPKNFENELTKRNPFPTNYRPSSAPTVHLSPGYFDAPAKQDLYEDITPISQHDSYLIAPQIVHLSDFQYEPLP